MRKNKITAILLVLMLVLIAALAVACNDDKEENPEITPISLTLGANWKNVYAVGEAFAPCQMTVTYSDGSTQTVDVTADMLSGFDTSSAGAKQITVNYRYRRYQRSCACGSGEAVSGFVESALFCRRRDQSFQCGDSDRRQRESCRYRGYGVRIRHFRRGS